MGSDATARRDFTKGPVFDDGIKRWVVEVRYPDGKRLRKRFRREREASRFFGAENVKIESGTWQKLTPRDLSLAEALVRYRDYSKVQHRSHKSYVAPSLKMWERELNPTVLLSTVTSAQVEDVKLRRAGRVSRSTVDKDIGVLKSFFNWCVARGLASVNPVRKVKGFREDNTRLRYLTEPEYERLIEVAHAVHSPYLAERITLAIHTGLRRGNLFCLRWDQVDFLNQVLRVPRTKSNHPHAVPVNKTALETLERLHRDRSNSPYVFPHVGGKHDVQPVMDAKNAFHAALDAAGIEDFTWHDLRHTFASWLVMRGASLRAVADLLGHRSLKMAMRYAHLSPAYLAQEVGLLDKAAPTQKRRRSRRARKGQGGQSGGSQRAETSENAGEIGSSGKTRTYNPPVNSRMLCQLSY